MLAPRPLRIVHVFRAPVGGLFRHVADLARAQTVSSHQVGIICDASTGGNYEDAILRDLDKVLAFGVTRIAMPRQMSPLDLWAGAQVYRRLGAIDPEVIHGHGAKGGVYARMVGALPGAMRRKARVYTPHGGSLHYDPTSLIGRIYFTAERIMERYTDAIIHVCQFEADTYRRKIGPPRCLVKVIPNGLNEDEFIPVQPHADARDLLFLGAFRDLKGIDVLLNAIAKLQTADGLRVSASLVGQPDGRAAYEMMAQELGIADRLAFHDPMRARDAFATARAVTVPSRAESMPYVVLEAVAAGMPVVTTNVGGIPEIFGTEAGLVPAGDADALASAIKSVVTSPALAREAAEVRREQIETRFSVRTMEQDITAIYVEILCEKTH
ncbi:MAG TPA: glycosyltransferase family 4 protein [Xanthobacteraceae bacterium]|nr:glycosyltransferase family 4 protein [Xanthobacteraceae bacterium]